MIMAFWSSGMEASVSGIPTPPTAPPAPDCGYPYGLGLELWVLYKGFGGADDDDDGMPFP
jgi:hypothetical protein